MTEKPPDTGSHIVTPGSASQISSFCAASMAVGTPCRSMHIGGSARILPDRARHSASHDTVARLRAHGAEIFGEIAQFESMFLLCYLCGPAGIIVALAEQIG
jgi:hypothetical protein